MKTKKWSLGKFTSLEKLRGHIITYGYKDTDDTTTGILYKESGSFKVLDHDNKIQRIDGPEQVIKTWGKVRRNYF